MQLDEAEKGNCKDTASFLILSNVNSGRNYVGDIKSRKMKSVCAGVVRLSLQIHFLALSWFIFMHKREYSAEEQDKIT